MNWTNWFSNVPRKKTRSKTRPRFQVARVVAHTHIDIDMHIRVYIKFHFHLHLQSYLSNWHIIYVVNYIRSNINVHHLLFAGVRTATTPAPDQPEPSSSPARVSWYVSNVSTFPHAFPLVLDSNLHDLNETNHGLTLFSAELPWCCFCAEIEVLGFGQNFSENYIAINKKYWNQDPLEGGPAAHQAPGRATPLWRALVGSGAHKAPLTLISVL